LSETKITVIYDNPTDPEAFEKAYGTDQLAAAKAIPGHTRVETSKVWPKEDGSPTPAYRMIDLYYPDYVLHRDGRALHRRRASAVLGDRGHEMMRVR
jgi:uncharacterized protein (TIGR02118 family)